MQFKNETMDNYFLGINRSCIIFSFYYTNGIKNGLWEKYGSSR